MIIDLILTIASMGFVVADLKQAWKLWLNKKFDTSAFSKTHFRIKILSLSMVIIAYTMLGVYIALSVAISQLVLNIYIHHRIGWRH